MSFRVGQRVEHEAFGSGLVTAVTSVGFDERVTVKFDRCGSKTIATWVGTLRSADGSNSPTIPVALEDYPDNDPETAGDQAPKERCHCGGELGHRGRHRGHGRNNGDHYKPEKIAEAQELLMAGNSIRQTAQATGLAKQTVQGAREEIAQQLPNCPCGQPAGHNGWCSHRFQNSPERQKTMEEIHKTQRVSVEQETKIITKREPAKENPINETRDQISELAELGDTAVNFWGRPVSEEFLDCLWVNLTSKAKAQIIEHLVDTMFPVTQRTCPRCKAVYGVQEKSS